RRRVRRTAPSPSPTPPSTPHPWPGRTGSPHSTATTGWRKAHAVAGTGQPPDRAHRPARPRRSGSLTATRWRALVRHPDRLASIPPSKAAVAGLPLIPPAGIASSRRTMLPTQKPVLADFPGKLQVSGRPATGPSPPAGVRLAVYSFRQPAGLVRTAVTGLLGAGIPPPGAIVASQHRASHHHVAVPVSWGHYDHPLSPPLLPPGRDSRHRRQREAWLGRPASAGEPAAGGVRR